MLILLNPFNIVRCFCLVIEEVAADVHAGRISDDLEIGFDAIFPRLMASVVAFGVDEWLQTAF
jgi:hypothetical protein